jgi:hypothetical protein
MKILFIFKSENFLVPIGLCVISAMAHHEGHEVYLSEMNSEDPLERIAKLKPDVVAYSSSTGESKHYIRLNQRIKERYFHYHGWTSSHLLPGYDSRDYPGCYLHR